MPRLIRLEAGAFRDADDPFTPLEPGQEPAPGVPVLAPLDRFRSEGAAWLDAGLTVGVRLAADEGPEGLSNALPRLALVALDFPVFRDGRAAALAGEVSLVPTGFAPFLLLSPMKKLRAASALSQLYVGVTRVTTPHAPTSNFTSCLRWVMMAVE